MDFSQLLKSVTSTSGESESTEEEKPAKKPDRFQKLEDGYTEQFAMLGAVLMPFSGEDGVLIVARSPHLAHKLVDVARVNPAVYKALKRYLEGSAYLNLAGELVTISLAIMANHGFNPVASLIEKFKSRNADGNADLPAVA